MAKRPIVKPKKAIAALQRAGFLIDHQRSQFATSNSKPVTICDLNFPLTRPLYFLTISSTMPTKKSLIPVEPIERRILLLRSHKIILDADLAELYGVPTKRLNEQVKRNKKRFPQDFMFRLTKAEVEAFNRSQIATGSQKHRDPRFPPYAFTEYGAIMAASVLNTPRAHKMMVYIVRAFVNVRVLVEDLPGIKHLVAKHEEDIEELQIAVEYLLETPEKLKKQIGFKPGKKD